MEVIAQVSGVIPPGQADDLDRVPLVSQILYQLAVVQITAAERVE